MKTRLRKWRAPVLGVAVALLLVAVLTYRSTVLNDRDAQLCGVIRAQIERSMTAINTKGTPGYSYYHAHPGERDSVIKSNRQFLRDLPC